MPILYYFENLELWCCSLFGWQWTIYQIFAWKFLVEHDPHEMPCTPSPCGLNSQCRELDNHAVCSCLPDMIGAPPNCRPECLVSSECPLDKSCINQKCRNPCENVCGLNSRCTVVNHNPICSCHLGFTGDPFVRCIKEEQRKKIFAFQFVPLRFDQEFSSLSIDCQLFVFRSSSNWNHTNCWLCALAVWPKQPM